MSKRHLIEQQRDELAGLAEESLAMLTAWAKAYRESGAVVDWPPPHGNQRLCEKLRLAIASAKAPG